MKTFEFSDDNGNYGGATIILSATDWEDALSILNEMVNNADDFVCYDQEGEDEDE